MSKKLLFLASNYGLWGEELQGPWDACKEAGFELTIATYTGKTPLPMKPSVEPGYADPVSGEILTPENVAERVNEILDAGEWENPKKIREVEMADYDVLVITGGPGAPFDLPGWVKVQKLITDAYQSGKTIGAICAGVAALGFTRHPEEEDKSIAYGKEVAAYPAPDVSADIGFDMEYNLARATEENKGSDIVTPGFIIPVEYIMKDAVGDADLVQADPEADRDNPVVVYDQPFVTAQSVESAAAFGEKIVEVLT